jgi:2-iminobutanoate/2-iminopropanoate deaminase
MLATTADTTDDACSGSLLRRRGRVWDFTRGKVYPRLSRWQERGKAWKPFQGFHTGCIVRPISVDIIATEAAPKAIGPYVQAVAVPAGRMVFCSGQIPLDPISGELVGAGDIRQQTHRVMKNLDAVLVAAGTSFAKVVKTNIYLVDLGNFAVVNEVYATYFTSGVPARTTVQVAALPRGAQIEIDAVALAS